MDNVSPSESIRVNAAAPRDMRVVGIAASAGGLEALHVLLSALPETPHLSFVVAQHGSPAHASSLVELLARRTALRVLALEDAQAPEAGTLYVTPAGRNAVFADGRFRLVEPQTATGPRPSADTLFRSMAEGLGEHAIGIVLSGTGDDGAAGLLDLKAAGGVTIAQDPTSARYDGMPKAAINTAGVDLVLRPDEIGPALLRMANQDLAATELVALDRDADAYAQVAHLVRVRTGFRLDDYKTGTVGRRIVRRMGLLNLPSLTAYIGHLRNTPDEAHQLVRDTFISVTSFFRDTTAYHALETAIGALVRDAQTGVVRCWVPGCASGEEAYSIAMLFEEALRTEQRADIQYLIFASDLDDVALETARGATYALNALAHLPQPLRERYVETQGSVGRVLKSIRNRMVFARQNVITDPPFSRMDLISCRNLLIYLTQPVQHRVLEVFHYALRPNGRLFLGQSESADAHADLYAPVDPHARLYSRREGAAHYALPPDRVESRTVDTERSAGIRRAESGAEKIGQLALEQLVQRYAPPSLVVNDTGRILHFQGALKPFLDFPSGRAEMHLFEMVAPAIRAELQAQVYRTRRDRGASLGTAHPHLIDDVPHQVRVRVEPLERDTGGLVLVSFIAMPDTPPDVSERNGRTPDFAIITELEQELATARSHLSVVVEELASSNEDLQSMTEELQSTNEALQSSNEELQTSNEELQSTNEELRTSNDELHLKSGELEATATLLTNVKQSLDFPLLVVDEQRMILDANSACAALVYRDGPLRGLSLNAVPWRIAIADVERGMREVLASGHRQVLQQPGDTGRQYQLHLMPFRQGPARIVGVVMLFEDVTAMREAVAARLDSDSRYRQVTESLPQLVWTCTAEGPCDYLSPQWVAYTGIPEAEQLGFAWLDQLHPDDRQHTIDHWSHTAQQGLDFEIEFRIRRHDGVYRWFHTQARPVRGANGAIVKWFGSNTDIHDRKCAEQEIREMYATLEQRVAERTAELVRTSDALGDTVRRLDDLYHNAPCGYHSVDADGRLVLINDTELEWLGYTREELLGRPIATLLTDSSRQLFGSNFPRVQAGETVSNLEMEFVRKDGSPLPLLVSARPVLDSEGRFVQGRAVLQRTRQHTLRRILTAAPMAVRIARLSDQRVVFMNQAYTELVKRTPEEAMQVDVRRYYVDQAAFADIARRLGAGETVRNQLVELHRPEGPDERVWALASFMVIDYEGEPSALAWLFDVTELHHARRAAEEASRTKSRFLANMSHEIRTPMNGVIGMIDLARRGLEDPQRRDRLDKAAQSAHRLLAILNDILDLSKIEAGHMRLNLVATDLSTCLDNTRLLFEPAAQQKGLRLVVEPAPALVSRRVLADGLRLGQVLDNLVNNAIKFSSQGTVRLSAMPMSVAGGDAALMVRFEVTDEGPGIAPEDQVRVFNVFEQLDGSAARAQGGTGLGLSICRRLVAMMGGEIGVHSVLGEGSTFWFTARFEPTRALSTASIAPAVDQAMLLRSRFDGARVLLAEDEPINQELLSILLEELGLKVELVPDGRQAVAAASRQRFDLILMDMQMPRLSGVEATVEIRRGGPNQHTAIVALTANVFDEDRQRCLEAGMTDFMTKPISPEELPGQLLALLGCAPPMKTN